MIKSSLKSGDKVRLISIPEWLTHDLPEEDSIEIKSCIGKVANILEIDKFGYFWLDFNDLNKIGSIKKGYPSFCVSNENLEIA